MNPRRERRSPTPEPAAPTAQQPEPPMEVEAIELPLLVLEANQSIEEDNNADIKMVLVGVAYRSILTVAFYPFKMAKFLIQMGYEPYFVRKERNFMAMGRESYLLLNSLAYVNYIRQVDGIWGCYRGFFPYSAYQLLLSITRQQISNAFAKYIKPHVVPQLRLQVDREEANADHRAAGDAGRHFVQVVVEDYGDGSDDARMAVNWVYFKRIFWQAIQEVVSVGGASILCYPLRTFAFLSVSEFVGRDGIMSRGFIHGVSFIYKTRGISALYGGLVPKLIGDSLQICLVGAINFGLYTQFYFLPRYMMYSLRSAFAFVGSGLAYPFQMISVTMAVCNAGFRFGRPPYMVRHHDWRDCWTHLSNANVLNRGSSQLFRYYTGPVNAAGEIVPTLGINIGPDFRNILR